LSGRTLRPISAQSAAETQPRSFPGPRGLDANGSPHSAMGASRG